MRDITTFASWFPIDVPMGCLVDGQKYRDIAFLPLHRGEDKVMFDIDDVTGLFSPFNRAFFLFAPPFNFISSSSTSI